VISPIPGTRLDPVTLEVAWRRLITVMDEVDAAVIRTSFSTIVGDGHDFACVLLDERGYSLAESTYSSNLFTVMLPRTTRHLIQHFGEDNIHDGDIYLTNDPWLGSGHLPDMVVVSPVFFDGRRVAFIGTVAHVADVGGNVGYHNARTIYEEGLQVPPLKLYDRGTPSDDLFTLLARNVRVPDMVIGDVRAFVSSHFVGQMRLREFLQDNPNMTMRILAENIHYLSENAMRAALREIPAGRYHCAVEADGFDDPLRIAMTLTLDEDGTLAVDLAGSSPEVQNGAINCTLNTTLGDILIALKCSLVPSLPNNEGLFLPISVTAPEGTIFNCRYPSAVKARSKTSVHTHEALYGALADLLPQRIQAGSTSFWIFIASGQAASGLPFSAWLIARGGKGALAYKDGVSAVNFPSNGRGAPAEILENHSPILVEQKEFNPDSAGPGEYRGGFGQRVVISSLTDLPMYITLRPNNVKFRAPGMLGGRAGALGRYYHGYEVPPLAPFALARGERVIMEIPGGGGAGDPFRRNPQRVQQDVANGLVSVEAALRDYGVVIDPQTGQADLAATQEQRGKG
jgi:N-methylhydantoinase B/oxoprolinase/acetone carboxylase alpha subunit